ncbi:hypothetical protein M9H77_27022 [Catharanthus roseus]|uniref:Uncharacterized protein n=1 Tax=Catharanthus roseus TaxID=4058 RepID=A0ACC0ADH4_CATRO|nr:hypothetical protein M9H77_27022 [Catharanthus roseus]
MGMAKIAYKVKNITEQNAAMFLIAGFTGQLKYWWDNSLTLQEKMSIIEHTIETEDEQGNISLQNDSCDFLLCLSIHDDDAFLWHRRLDHIYNQQNFKRMGFEKNEEGAFIQDDDEDQEVMNVEEEENEEETEAEIHRRETRQKKRQEIIEEGSSSGSMSQLMDMIASL